MLKNYFTIALRNLWKNKVYSGINIFGMAIGLACCLTIGLFIQDELSYDRFHTHGENIYRVVEKQVQAGEAYNVAVTPGPLGMGGFGSNSYLAHHSEHSVGKSGIG